MSLDIEDTIRSTFGRFKTSAGLSVLSLLLGMGLIGLGFTFAIPSLLSMGGAGILAAGAAGVILAVAGLVVTIGSIRCLNAESFEVAYFVSNIKTPFLRFIGSYLTVAAFTLLAVAIGVIAVGAVGYLLAQLGVGQLIGMQTLMSLMPTVAAVAGGIVGLFALYPLISLSLSIPRIAIEGERLFESLDSSVVATSSRKLGIFLASLPVLILYILNRMTAGMATGTSQMGAPGQIPSKGLSSAFTPELGPSLVMVAVSAIFATSLYSFLVELNQRL